MAAAPARTDLADTYPNPTNSVFRTGIGKLWDFLTGLLGTSGTHPDALNALRLLDPSGVYNLSLVPSVGSSALTMALKTRAGETPSSTDPGMVAQRNATAGTGDFNLRSITSAVSLTISSGSTLGHSSGVPAPIYWYLLDNAGTEELAASTSYFGRSGIVSTTAEGGAGAADSATVMYSATARTNVPFRLIGSTLDTQTVAGTWGALPSEIAMVTLEQPVQSRLNVAESVGGTVDAITATFRPAFTALVDKARVTLRAAGANTSTTPTFAPDGLTAKTIVRPDLSALAVGDIAGAGHEIDLVYNLAADKWVLLSLLSVYTAGAGIDISAKVISSTIAQNSKSSAYTLVLSDANKHILHPSSDNNARTFTIPANASVAYPIGTAITFVNEVNTVTIAINSDTLKLAGSASTGSRTLAANGIATALKTGSTTWWISGTGLS